MTNQVLEIIQEDKELQVEAIEIEISNGEEPLDISVEEEYETVELLETWKYVVMYSITFAIFIGLCIYTIFFYESEDEHENSNSMELFIKKMIIYASYVIIAWLNGKFLKGKLDMKVNYTRKINHILIWFIPPAVDAMIQVDETFLSSTWNVFAAFSIHLLFMLPIRNLDKTGFINTIFSTIDRPEDRPNTLKWMISQNAATGLSIIPFNFLFDKWGLSKIMLIPLMIVTFGDGLAEPIGIRFGKHKYKTTALFTDKTYTRSYEGSACVFLSGVIMIGILYNEFETLEFILNMALIPIMATLAEAFAPHTFDNPLIIISTGGILALTHLQYEL